MDASDAGEGEAGQGEAGPRVSVVMANWRGERHVGAAVASVLRQTEGSLELLLADDGSDDGSEGAARAAARGDARLRWLPGAARGGPSAARNRALDAARGAWVAVMDSDDLLHPRRLELLLALAEDTGADLVADDLLHFGEGPDADGRTLLGPLGRDAPFEVDATAWVRGNAPGGGPSLGYLKPLVRRSTLGALRYDTSLRVAEDYDIVLRLLLKGARLVVAPQLLYLYRRHPGSTSHRWPPGALEAMLAAHGRQAAEAGGGALGEAMGARGRGLARELRFQGLVEALKGRRAGGAFLAAARDPGLLAPLARSAAEGLARRLRRGAPPAPRPPARLALVSAGRGLPGRADPEAARDGLLGAPPLDPRAGEGGAGLRALALDLGARAARGPITLTLVGADALDAAWLLPGAVVAEAWLAEGEAARSPLPDSATLRRG